MISIYLKQLIDPSFENIIVKGALERFRDFIYVDDIVSITTSYIFQESTFNEIINIGTGKMTSVYDLLFLLKHHTGISKEIDFLPGTPCDQFEIYANINKLGEYYNSTLITVENGINLFCESVLRKQTL
jgi:UDP-glucose 4-epimerase